MNTVSPKIQNQINMLQQMQQQLQTVAAQKGQYELATQEARRALEELGDVPDDASVYMTIGTVVMQKPRQDVIGKLTEKIEGFELRISSIEKQEKLIQEKFEKLQAQVKDSLEKRSSSDEEE